MDRLLSTASLLMQRLISPIIESIEPVLVPQEGLEPPHLSVTDFESAASTVPPLGLTYASTKHASSALRAKCEAIFRPSHAVRQLGRV